jgi:hypothetical protein
MTLLFGAGNEASSVFVGGLFKAVDNEYSAHGYWGEECKRMKCESKILKVDDSAASRTIGREVQKRDIALAELGSLLKPCFPT